MVYVANNKGQNLEAAKQYGNIKDITSGNQPLFETKEMVSRVVRGLKDFKPEKDYIACVGPSLLLMIISAYLATKFPSTKIKYLVFDAKAQTYRLQYLGGM